MGRVPKRNAVGRGQGPTPWRLASIAPGPHGTRLAPRRGVETANLPRPRSRGYHRRAPEETVLYQVVQENLNTFLALSDARADDRHPLPRYVRNAFRRFLNCGILAKGFARVRCPECGYSTVVAYS